MAKKKSKSKKSSKKKAPKSKSKSKKTSKSKAKKSKKKTKTSKKKTKKTSKSKAKKSKKKTKTSPKKTTKKKIKKTTKKKVEKKPVIAQEKEEKEEKEKKPVEKLLPKKKKKTKRKVADLDLLHDPLIRSGAVAAFALFTLILLMPVAPCKSVPVREGFSGEVWDMCGKDGWDAMSPGFTLEGVDTYLLGSIDLTGPERWFIFAGVFGLFYMIYLKLYNDFADYLTS